jgi:hypothetical protein
MLNRGVVAEIAPYQKWGSSKNSCVVLEIAVYLRDAKV